MTEDGAMRMKFGSCLKRTIRVARPIRRGTCKIAIHDLPEVTIQKQQDKQMGRRILYKNELEVARADNFPVLESKEHDVSAKTLHDIKTNRITDDSKNGSKSSKN